MMSLSEVFLSLELGLIYGVVAIGIYLTFRIIDFPDLSCDGSFVTGAAICAMGLKSGFHPALCLLVAAFGGGVVGMITGCLFVYGRISALLSGILTAFMLYSLNLRIMNGVPNLTLINEATIFLEGHALVLLIVLGVFTWLCFGYIFTTDFGLALRSIGQNKRLATTYGVNIASGTMVALALSNGLVAFAGGLYCQHQGFADISQGVGTVIMGLAAVMIGEKVLPFRSMWISLFSCFIGSMLYRLLVASALYIDVLGLESSDLNLITGLLVIIMMIFPTRRRKQEVL